MKKDKDFWDKITELEELAKKATPGPWEADEFMGGVDTAYAASRKQNGEPRTYGYGCDETFICDLNDGEYHEYTDYEEQKANCQFIAAANPAMILEMVAEIRRLEKEADWLAGYVANNMQA